VKITGTPSAPKIDFDVKANGVDAAVLREMSIGPLDVSAAGNWGAGGLTLRAARLAGWGGLKVTAAGTLAADAGAMDIATTGTLPLALFAAQLAKNNITARGQGRFDLRLSGAPARPDINGRVQLSGASLALLRANIRLNDIALTADFSGQTMTLTGARANIAAGGRISASGTIELSPDLPLDITIGLDRVQYSDAKMLSTSASGEMRLYGAAAQALNLGGALVLGVTEIQVPSGSPASVRLLNVIHKNPGRPARRTLARAGLTPSGVAQAPAGPALNLDLAVSAPQQIFVRGRGLDAELGGALRLSGALRDMRAIGQFDLIRGRMKFLDRRFDFTKGAITLSGTFDPQLDFLAKVRVNALDIDLRVGGSASEPEIRLSSVPELPQDEILARLIFARGMADLSPFQIIQLASAVAELSGRSGAGLVEKLRRASGLDNLDVGQNAAGETAVRAGKYLDSGIYTEVEISPGGNTKYSINLDVMDDVTASGSFESDGRTSLGIFYERDY
jgi:translocation and assembly module TamB